MCLQRSAIAFVIAFCVTPAQAQMSETEKRKLLLPAIRTATDCIARESARHPEIVQGYRYNNLSPMIADGWRACTNQLVQLVTMHDNLHGAGTGMVFVKGAYSDDLPRAVRARLKSELDGRIAALDRAEAVVSAERARLEVERQQNIERLEKAADRLRDRAYECTTPQLEKLVSSAESADVLATAAMTICRREIDDAIQARVDIARSKLGTGYVTASEPADREEMRKIVRTSVITTAVQLKAGISQRPAAAATVPAAVPPAVSTSPPPIAVAASLPKELRDCLSKMATARNGKFIDQRELYEGMLELCRPEIEAAARTSFLANKDADLAKERERALTDAGSAAKAMIGMN